MVADLDAAASALRDRATNGVTEAPPPEEAVAEPADEAVVEPPTEAVAAEAAERPSPRRPTRPSWSADEAAADADAALAPAATPPERRADRLVAPPAPPGRMPPAARSASTPGSAARS